jgi:hypothetical protein
MTSQTTDADRSPFEPGSLTSVADVHDLHGRHASYPDVLDWLTTFIARPHPELGRDGPICPMVAPALRRDLIRLVTACAAGHDAAAACEIGPALADLFTALADEVEFGRSGALLAIFRDLPQTGAAGFIDGGHRRMRMDFVARGLMLGEFHPASSIGSVHQPAFPVMRSPVPMYAVRTIHPHDLIFLDRPGTPPQQRAAYLEHYLTHLDGRLSPTTRARALAAHAAATQEQR